MSLIVCPAPQTKNAEAIKKIISVPAEKDPEETRNPIKTAIDTIKQLKGLSNVMNPFNLFKGTPLSLCLTFSPFLF